MLRKIFLEAVLMILLIAGSGCKKSCRIQCLNGGTCTGGSCSCPDPYSGINCDTLCTLGLEGYMCQTLSREKFIGTWSCRTSDQSGSVTNYLLTITDDSYQLFMDMNNFNNSGGYPIICTLTGKYKFDINTSQQGSQGMAAGVSGYGQMQNGSLVIYLNTNTSSYFTTGTRQ